MDQHADEPRTSESDEEHTPESDEDPTLPPLSYRRAHITGREPPILLKTDQEDEDDEDVSPFRHMEIVGLKECGNGRVCERHLFCGEQVVVGDIMRLQKCVVDSYDLGSVEPAIACVLIRGGSETCRVAFVPRVLLKLPMVKNNVDKHIQVVEMFASSRNSAKRRKDFLNCGMAGVIFLDEIPKTE
jgi:hypothetical protein